jgi:hypothetical protein
VSLLVIGSDVSLATSLILEDTILEGEGQGTRKLARLKTTLRGGRSYIDGLNIESSRGGSLATSWRALCQSRSGKGKNSEGLHFQRVD